MKMSDEERMIQYSKIALGVIALIMFALYLSK